MLKVYMADEVHARLDYPRLIAALREAFRVQGVEQPLRASYPVGPDVPPVRLLSMPAWQTGEAIGVKLVTVFPQNAAKGLGAVSAVYVLFDGETGVPRAILDGEAITNRRTAAASALASSYLSRPDSEVLLLVGTGNLAPCLAEAHSTVRPISRILVWGRNAEKAERLATALAAKGRHAEPIADLRMATAEADIISCATTSSETLIRGRDLRPGTHLDLVGAFTPQMRETDDDAVARSSVFVDTYAGALAEAGDLVLAAQSGAWSAERVRGDLHELAAGLKPGRVSAEEITLFKSVGAAIEDLTAARLVVD